MRQAGTAQGVSRHAWYAAATAAILSASILLAPSAWAHANLVSSSPKDGAQLASAPASIRVTFDERVTINGKGTRILDGNGRAIASTTRLSNKNKTLTVTPTSPLGKGRFLVTYNVDSVESHLIPGALAFSVGMSNPSGSPVTVATMPKVPTTLSAPVVGARTITLTTPIRSGEVWWHSALVPEPLVWQLHGDGTKASASGMLPLSGDWSFDVNLSTADTILVPKGRVTIQ